MWRNWGPQTLLWGVHNGTVTMEISGALPQYVNMELPYGLATPLPDVHPEELKTGVQTEPCAEMFTSVLVTTARRWKFPQNPSTEEPMHSMQSTHTMEYYSAMKREWRADPCHHLGEP